ncbi:MAG: SDR family oxidoreductase [Deltaproteobacteria bacterium]|nr:SDR family oxidoreductase [Deltaproteobacteria bacterium]
MSGFENKRVCITGGAGGIGLCLVREFLRAGARVLVSDVDAAALDRVPGEIGAGSGELLVRQVDVSDREAVGRFAAWVQELWGGLDVLVNNAGIGCFGELIETPIATWQKLMGVNFWGPLYHVEAFLPGMVQQGGGQVINVSSGQAFFRLPTWGAYATSKAALGIWSELLSAETRKLGIYVTTVYPFMVDTGFYQDIEGETWTQKLSMKLVPYYSMSAERVARIIFKAAERRKRVEMVSPLNDMARLIRLLPGGALLSDTITVMIMGKDAAEIQRAIGDEER